MGSEDEAEQSFGRPCRQTGGRSKRTCELTSSIVPRGTSFHGSVELECPPIEFDLLRRHAAAAACSRVQRNSVPSTQMRCRITASRRASATIAFFIPRRLAICIAQALSQDHLLAMLTVAAAGTALPTPGSNTGPMWNSSMARSHSSRASSTSSSSRPPTP